CLLLRSLRDLSLPVSHAEDAQNAYHCFLHSCRGILRQFGPSIARLFLFFMALSNGMFISSTAFLPSSFSMYMTALTFGAWLQQHHKIVILTQAISTLIGWPFTALLGYAFASKTLNSCHFDCALSSLVFR